ncbi:hypothetical protein GCM10009804_47230 [Kribbella hippodromi]|uniref:Uncharacterized protein n=1 Tax=Kribbella hippodromi TaxID=434347 RepID=A0ABP4PMW0_9ACTN
MLRKIIVTALAVIAIAVTSAAPAAAVERKDFEIKDPAGTGSDAHGRLNTYGTYFIVKGRILAFQSKVTAYACISASISGCNLVGNQKTLGTADGRVNEDEADINKRYNRASGQAIWVRACFLHPNGVTNCTSWTAGHTANTSIRS